MGTDGRVFMCLATFSKILEDSAGVCQLESSADSEDDNAVAMISASSTAVHPKHRSYAFCWAS